MSRTLDEIIEGFKTFSGSLNMAPNGGANTPFASAMTTTSMTPPLAQVRSPLEAAQSIASGSYPTMPQFNFPATQQGQQSFQTANALGQMGPQAQYMTPYQYGGFRPQMPQTSPMGFGNIPPVGMPMPSGPTTSFFTPPGELAAQIAQQHQRQLMMSHSAGQMAMTQLGFAGATAFGGSALGAAMGGMMGGGAGARFGAMAGGIAGGAFGMSSVGDFAAASMGSSGIHQRAMGMRLQESSRGFMTGSGAGITGQGLSAGDAAKLASQLTTFSNQSGGVFNRRDMANIMQISADQGLLDFAQNGDQIARSVKTISTVVATLAKVTGDPDLRKNLQLIGQMQRFGMSPVESMGAMANARSFARLAGVDVHTLMEREGMAGAATFQGAGLTGASGAMSAMFNAGVSRSLMQSGAVSPTLAGLMGGQSGMTQQLTGAEAAFMSGPGKMLLAGLVKQGRGGLTLDQDAISGVTSGRMDIGERMQQAGRRMGSPQAIAEMAVQGPQLLADLDKQLRQKPEQMQMFMLQYIKSIQQALGGSKAGVTFGAAAMNAGFDANTANLLQQSMSGAHFENMRRQMQVQEFEAMRNRASLDAARPGVIRSRMGNAWRNIRPDALGTSDEFSAQMQGEDEEDARAAGMGRSRIRSDAAEGDTAFWSSLARPRRASALGSAIENFSTKAGLANKIQRGLESVGADDVSSAIRRSQGGFTGAVERYGGGLGALGAGLGTMAEDVYGAAAGISPAERGAMRADAQRQKMAALSASERIVRGGEDMTNKEFAGINTALSKAVGGRDQFSRMMSIGSGAMIQQGKQLGGTDATRFGQEVRNQLHGTGFEKLSPEMQEQALQAMFRFTGDVAGDYQSNVSRDVRGGSAGVGQASSATALRRAARSQTALAEDAMEDFMGRGIVGRGINAFSKRDQEKIRVLGALLKRSIKVARARGKDENYGRLLLQVAIVIHHGGESNGIRQYLAKLAGDPKTADLYQDAVDFGNTMSSAELANTQEMGRAYAGTAGTQSVGVANDKLKKLVNLAEGVNVADADEKQLASSAEALGLKISGEGFNERMESFAKGVLGLDSSKTTDAMRKAANKVRTSPTDTAAQDELLKAAAATTGTGGTIMSAEAAEAGGGVSRAASERMANTGAFMDQFKDDFSQAAAAQVDSAEQLRVATASLQKVAQDWASLPMLKTLREMEEKGK